MNIPVILNGNKIILEAQSDESLLSVLHKKAPESIKCGCQIGSCGACTVLLNDQPAAACKIPVGIVRNCDIVTLDYFSKTEEYGFIIQGFKKAGIKLCGYCNAGKIFSAYQLFQVNKKLTREEIKEQVNLLSPCCTDLETLVNGIIFAISLYNNEASKSRHSSRSVK